MSGIIVIRLAEVMKIGGIRRSTVYNKLNPKSNYHDPSFPRPIKLGAASVGWVKYEVEAWVQAQIAKRDIGAEG